MERGFTQMFFAEWNKHTVKSSSPNYIYFATEPGKFTDPSHNYGTIIDLGVEVSGHSLVAPGLLVKLCPSLRLRVTHLVLHHLLLVKKQKHEQLTTYSAVFTLRSLLWDANQSLMNF